MSMYSCVFECVFEGDSFVDGEVCCCFAVVSHVNFREQCTGLQTQNS